jgi:hypothetical protein
MKTKEAEVTREIRAVRDRMARRVEQEGIFALYASLEGRAAKLMARHRSPRHTALPHNSEARKARRRALVDALPQPEAIQEVRRIRDRMREDSSSSAFVLHDKPVKYKTR